MFSFNFLGKDSYKDFGIYVEERPSMPLPERNVTLTEVPGLNGSLMEDDGTYKDIVISVKCNVIDNNLPNALDNIRAWLSSGRGDLIFSNQPDKKYEGRVIEQIDISQETEILGSFEVNFQCKPFKYEVNPQTITLTSKESINNLGSFEANPIIKVYGSGNITLNVNDNAVTLTNVADYITIDCKLMDCYKDTLLCNNQMGGEFPKLKLGNNTIDWVGNVIKVEITPNWRWI